MAVATRLVTSGFEEVGVGSDVSVDVGMVSSEVVDVNDKELVETEVREVEVGELVVGTVVFCGMDITDDDVTGGGVDEGIAVVLVFVGN